MPFRQRVKAVFSRSSTSSSSTSSPTSLTTISSRNDSSVFKPGEAMPRLKYRAPVDRKHKEKLESFRWPGSQASSVASSTTSSARRTSVTESCISPGGSRRCSFALVDHAPSAAAVRRAATHKFSADDESDSGVVMVENAVAVA